MLVRALLAAACLGLPLVALAQDRGEQPQLRLPELGRLQQHAAESVNVTLGPLALSFAGAFVDGHDPGMAQIRKTFFEGIESVTVRSYQFDTDVVAGPEIGDLRQQLNASGWSRLVQVHDRGKGEDVGVYLVYDAHSVRQLAVLAVGRREITLVHVTGHLDPSRLAQLRLAIEHPDPAVEPSAPQP